MPIDAPQPGPTPQQATAVATRGVSVVLSSGAGCGKTQVLTDRYLSHLRTDGAEIGQLLAITFTDRAAREMRSRIRKAIVRESSLAETSADRERWDRHLRNLETANISTIHAFCGTLLRQHAIAAAIDPRFEVLEDVLSANIRDDSLRESLHELLIATSPIGDDLRELVTVYGWRATVDAINHLLHTPDPLAWQEWSRLSPTAIADNWLVRRSEFLAEYVRHVIDATPKIARCLYLLRNTPCRGPKMRVNVAKVLAETPRLAEAPDLDEAITDLCEAAKVGPERGKAWPDEATYEEIKEALTGYRSELRKSLEGFLGEVEQPTDAAIVGQRFVRVAAACASVYQHRKGQAGVVDFNDLLTAARELLRNKPAIREQLRQRFRFVLIDELQDTDPVQMDIVEHLCGPGLTHGKLFAVGDAKQSIYRFRGAEVGLFQSLRETVPANGRQELSVNFRSQPGILKFVNALFREHMPGYESLIAHRPAATPGPGVEFLWTPTDKRISVAEDRRREAERIARRIVDSIACGERLVFDRLAGELRPVQLKDIVLLFRSMSNVAIYEAALRAAGLDYYLVGGRAFFAQQEIYDLLNLLRVLENPHDEVSLVGTLRSPFGCLSDDALYLLARHRDGIWAGLHDDGTVAALPADERPNAERARRFLDRWRDHKDRLPIAGLLNLVLADCGYDAAMQFESLGDRKLANLWKLIDLARTFDRSGLFGLADFIARLGELVRSQPREEQAATLPEESNVIRLMTIHQAKGLEFPVVILPDLSAEPGGAIRPAAHWDARFGCVARPPKEDGPALFSDVPWKLWIACEEVADWHEELRTFYVACTRAEDYLILSGAVANPPQPAGPAMSVLAERFDLATGDCRDRTLPETEQPQVNVIGTDVEMTGPSLPSRNREVPEPPTAKDAAAIGPVPTRRAPGSVIVIGDWDNEISPADRILRSVMRRWDFVKPEQWREVLVEAAASEPDGVAIQTELSDGLSAFAMSDLCRRLAAAVEMRHNVEFLLLDSESALTLHGRIDLLWREREGWHLLAWTSGESADDVWRGHKPSLLAAAWAVQRHCGAWPRSISDCNLARRKTVNAVPTESDARAAVAALTVGE